MDYQDKILKFQESLERVSNEKLLALFEEIDAQKQEGQLSMEEYFEKIDAQKQEGQLSMEEYFDEINEGILMCEKIKNTPLNKDYNFTRTSLETNFDLEKEILTAA